MFGIDERGRLGSYYIAGAIRIGEKKTDQNYYLHIGKRKAR
jgi:hypothetical protein